MKRSNKKIIISSLVIMPFISIVLIISSLLADHKFQSAADHGSTEEVFSSSEPTVTDKLPEAHECVFEISIIEPTCTSEGYNLYSCSCGYSYTEANADKLEHSYAESARSDATCTGEGFIEYLCQCGDKYTETLEIISHSYTETETPATCLSDGYRTYTCLCGDSYTEKIADKLEHSYSESLRVDATCAKEGFIEYLCACGDKYTEAIAMTAHNYTENIIPATCTEEGYIEYLCVCGDRQTTTLKIIAHRYAKSVMAATCTTSGSTNYTCECGNAYSVAISPKGHRYTATVTKATCTSRGYTTYTCECGDSYTDNYTAVTDHKWSDWIVKTEATTIQSGSEYSNCRSCGKTQTRTIEQKTAVNLDAIEPASMFNGISKNALKAVNAVLDCVDTYYGTGSTDTVYLGQYELTWVDVSMAESAIAFYLGAYKTGLNSTTFYYVDDNHYDLLVNLAVICEAEKERRIMMSSINDTLATFEAGSDEKLIEQAFCYLAENITYDSKQADATVALKTGRGSCNTYPIIFKIMMCQLGIECDICIGYAYTGAYHAWNRIQSPSGEYMYYDLTFYISTAYTSYKYFGSTSLKHDLVAVNRYLTKNDPI